MQNPHLSPKEEGLAVIRRLLFVCFANENQSVGSSCLQLQGSQLTPSVPRSPPALPGQKWKQVSPVRPGRLLSSSAIVSKVSSCLSRFVSLPETRGPGTSAPSTSQTHHSAPKTVSAWSLSPWGDTTCGVCTSEKRASPSIR